MKKILLFLKDINTHSKIVSEKTGKKVFFIKCSIIWSFIIYGASPANYSHFNFYKIGSDKKKTFVTNRISRKLIKKYNNPNYIQLFEDKVKFAEKFSEFFKRKWIFVDDCNENNWKSFIEKLKTNKVICKPIGQSQGVGISVINPFDYTFDDIKGKYSGCIIEEFIEQHHELSAFYDKAVNCLRVITVYDNSKVNLLVANLTFGSEYEIANASYGGITTEVNVETGKIISDGAQFDGKIYIKHPYSDKKFRNFQIPFWNEIVEMLNQSGKIVSQVRYVGWDIAITEDGPVIIEGNTTPGYKYFQIPEILQDGKGVKDRYSLFL